MIDELQSVLCMHDRYIVHTHFNTVLLDLECQCHADCMYNSKHDMHVMVWPGHTCVNVVH